MLIAAIPFSSNAETMQPDALLCETPEPFQVIASEGWTSKGAEAQLKTARASIEFSRVSGQAASIQRRLATQEEAIRADSSLRLASGSTAARATASTADANAAMAQGSIYEKIVATCASSGGSALPVEVVERKPISGAARIRLTFRGAPAELWVRTPDLIN